MSTYSGSYCVTCKAQTKTLGRHTIQLSKNRRAQKGICPVCATETYRLMPEKGQKRETQLSLISSQSRLPKSASAALRFKPSMANKAFAPMSQLPYASSGFADKLIHYGVLLVIFGLSFVIGFSLLKLIKNYI